MNKTALATALALSIGTSALTVEAGTPGLTGVFNSKYVFSMTSPGGSPVGTPTPPQNWVLDFDAGTISIENTATFYASVWTAHDVTFADNGDGTYSGVIAPDPLDPGNVNNTIPNMLFDWSVNADIPVEIVWDITEVTPGNLEVKTLTTVILSTSEAFPGFQPAFATPSIICGELEKLTDVNKSVDINISTDLLATCEFADGTVVLDSFTQPINGTVTENAGILTYIPSTDFAGVDSFTYTAMDDSVTAVAQAVNVQVGAPLIGNFTMLDSAGNTFGGTNDAEFTFGPGVDPNDPSTFNIDESDINFGKLEIVSKRPQPFSGFLWFAHDIRIFGPGTYAFDTGCTVDELKVMGCPAGSVGGKTISMIVGPDQIGAHILFDWSTSTNIDVVNVWNVKDPDDPSKTTMWERLEGQTGNTNKLFGGLAGGPPHEEANFDLVSTDIAGYTTPGGVLMPNGDGLNGAPMVDGPFEKFYANFSYKPDRGTSVEVLEITARDTTLGDSLLASLDLYALALSIVSLLGLRRFTIK